MRKPSSPRTPRETRTEAAPDRVDGPPSSSLSKHGEGSADIDDEHVRPESIGGRAYSFEDGMAKGPPARTPGIFRGNSSVDAHECREPAESRGKTRKRARDTSSACAAKEDDDRRSSTSAGDAVESPSTGVERAPAVLRTEGQRLLCEVPGSLGEVARRLGVKSRQSVSDWRAGRKVPGDAYRRELEAAYAIPAETWTLLPRGVERPVELPRRTERPSPWPNTLDEIEELISSVRDRRREAGITASERSKLVDTEARLIGVKARMQRAELDRLDELEDRIVREHPLWARLRSALIRELAPYPDLGRRIGEVFRSHGVGE